MLSRMGGGKEPRTKQRLGPLRKEGDGFQVGAFSGPLRSEPEMKTVYWDLRNVPEGADGGPGQQDREDLWEFSGAEITSQGSFQLKARERAFILQHPSVIG